MYEDLIKRLRSEAVYLPEKFSKNAELLDVLMKAADAIEELICEVADEHNARLDAEERQRWIPVTELLPSDFVSVKAHIVGAEPLPTVREAYVIDGKWFFPALKEFLPVDMWKRFDEPPEEG